jgi:hypothetical protein
VSELDRQKLHSKNAYFIDTVSFTFLLKHSRLLQHCVICVGFELDTTALVEEGIEFFQNTNHIAHCYITEREGTKVLQNTNQMAQCQIPKGANPLNSMR